MAALANIEKVDSLRELVHREFVGKDDVLDLLIICLLSGGHVLLEDVPGIGKTTLAKELSKATGLSMGRIQFTPDTLPSDVVGVSVYQMQSGEFVWKPGPVMNQILLADEINRTSPKTQAGLLEVMAEGQVSVDGKTVELPKPFMVIATQNPVEYAGTYPLPEAQLDRFMMKLQLGYPERSKELEIAKNELLRRKDELVTGEDNQETLTSEDILAMKAEVARVTVGDAVRGVMEDIIAATRNESRFRLGGSTRALLALMQASQAKAYISGRDFVKPDDVKALVGPVLAHRLVLTTDSRRQKQTAEHILKELMTHVRIPV